MQGVIGQLHPVSQIIHLLLQLQTKHTKPSLNIPRAGIILKYLNLKEMKIILMKQMKYGSFINTYSSDIFGILSVTMTSGIMLLFKSKDKKFEVY